MTVLTNILYSAGLIVIGVLLFELIIFFHEGGHFVAAKLSGVKVNEFALGMGPKLFSFTKGETTYSLRLLPIGGYCAMEGEDEDSDNPRAFNNAKIYKRMIIIIAGAVMNIVLGLIFMAIILLPNDYFATTTVNYLHPYSFSATSGLQVDDEIVSIDGYKINNSMDLSYSLATIKVQEVDGTELRIYKEDCVFNMYQFFISQDISNLSDEELDDKLTELSSAAEKINLADSTQDADKALKDAVSLICSYFPEAQENDFDYNIDIKDTRQRFRADVVVNRNGEEVTLDDMDFYSYRIEGDPEPKMAIDFSTAPKERTFLSLLGETGSQTVSVVRMVTDSLVGLVRGEFGFNDVSGPIGAASATVEVAQEGLKSGFGTAVSNIVYVMMIITVNLGVVNMLPFPALDGGRFVFLIIEGIFKKPIPRKFEAVVNAVGLGILLLFMLVISVKDIWMLFV